MTRALSLLSLNLTNRPIGACERAPEPRERRRERETERKERRERERQCQSVESGGESERERGERVRARVRGMTRARSLLSRSLRALSRSGALSSSLEALALSRKRRLADWSNRSIFAFIRKPLAGVGFLKLTFLKF
jgi:hypothetical protein